MILFSEHNITELDISNKNVIILISLDGIDWFDLGGDYLGGVLNNGDYCRINSDVNTLSINNRIEFTFGTGKYTSETSGNGWGIYFKIIFKSTVKTKYVGSLDLINWI